MAYEAHTEETLFCNVLVVTLLALTPVYKRPSFAQAAAAQIPTTIAKPMQQLISRTSTSRVAMPATGLWFNAGGGVLADGTDGMKFVFHCGGSANEQVWFTGQVNYFSGACSPTGFNMKIGGTNYGSKGSAWTSVNIREITGQPH